MILYIDTTSGEDIKLALGQDDVLIAKKIIKAKYKQSEKLLIEIDKILRKVQGTVDLSKLKSIVVVNGPGPFTATRIGVATANALSYALKIPIAGINNTLFNNIEELIKKGSKLESNKNNIVEPFYSQEPNITKSKK
jgi:tRNA threonylcarbamoyl adenosine modification protein YeaZ